nr:MAG TPA: hypothetical protein [Caudoviricetes sp.]
MNHYGVTIMVLVDLDGVISLQLVNLVGFLMDKGCF